ncbi:MAG TPA: hypothetical protein VKM93_20500 [Terriglobia bacterium]|nr:hypothetical protein [Terriglobia bacterium]
MAAIGSLDIRWPIGFIFTIYGVILLVFGGLGQLRGLADMEHGVVELPGGLLNVDLIWGGGFLVFGLLMAWMARRASRQP